MKEGKGKGAPAIRAGVFVIRPPFSQPRENDLDKTFYLTTSSSTVMVTKNKTLASLRRE